MITHIYNGDSLAHQLGVAYDSFIVMRECLIEGPVFAQSEEDFWNQRSEYLQKYAHEPSTTEYQRVRDEIEKLKTLPASVEICLWFEFDVFCQMNMWFLIHYIHSHTDIRKLSWIYPDHNKWSGFGGMDKSALNVAFQKRYQIQPSQQDAFCLLWKQHIHNKHDHMLSSDLSELQNFKKLVPTIRAIQGLYVNEEENVVVKSLRTIIENNSTISFEALFRQFNDEHGIYGFGDLQIWYLYKQLSQE